MVDMEETNDRLEDVCVVVTDLVEAIESLGAEVEALATALEKAVRVAVARG